MKRLAVLIYVGLSAVAGSVEAATPPPTPSVREVTLSCGAGAHGGWSESNTGHNHLDLDQNFQYRLNWVQLRETSCNMREHVENKLHRYCRFTMHPSNFGGVHRIDVAVSKPEGGWWPFGPNGFLDACFDFRFLTWPVGQSLDGAFGDDIHRWTRWYNRESQNPENGAAFAQEARSSLNAIQHRMALVRTGIDSGVVQLPYGGPQSFSPSTQTMNAIETLYQGVIRLREQILTLELQLGIE